MSFRGSPQAWTDAVPGALHLHPISKLLQLRTSLSYLDNYDSRVHDHSVSRRDRNGDDGFNGDKEKEEKNPKPKPNGVNASAPPVPGRPAKVSLIDRCWDSGLYETLVLDSRS